MQYKVWDDETIRSGDAKEVLQEMVRKAAASSETGRMSVDQYTKILIDNAAYYLPHSVLDELANCHYETPYDKALALLDLMPTSSARIITTGAD